jgi:RimJ/RimL family protein N-acetyltransferase
VAEPIEFDTPRLRLRCWREADRTPFATLNLDPAVMAYFPAPIGRDASDASIDAWTAQFAERGWSNWAVERLDSGEFIGFTGLSIPRRTFAFSPSSTSAGAWRARIGGAALRARRPRRRCASGSSACSSTKSFPSPPWPTGAHAP